MSGALERPPFPDALPNDAEVLAWIGWEEKRGRVVAHTGSNAGPMALVEVPGEGRTWVARSQIRLAPLTLRQRLSGYLTRVRGWAR